MIIDEETGTEIHAMQTNCDMCYKNGCVIEFDQNENEPELELFSYIYICKNCLKKALELLEKHENNILLK